MRIVIAGGHGKIALLLAEMLTGTGHSVVSLIRNPEHAPQVYATGAEAVVLDLERATVDDLTATLRGADAVVFAAGAGPGSGTQRKYTVDRDGSVLLADAAERAGALRFIQISTMGAAQPPTEGADEVWAAYIDAKTQAEADVRAHDLDWTILRPGRLTDEPATGTVTLATNGLLERGNIARGDVAAVIAALLATEHTSRTTLELVAGSTPIAAAVAAPSS